MLTQGIPPSFTILCIEYMYIYTVSASSRIVSYQFSTHFSHPQDYSAYFYPPLGAPGSVAGTAGSTLNGVFDQSIRLRNRPRQQGRLKLCSRGLLFEPSDRLLPLVKYPFRHMETQMEPMGAVAAVSEAGPGGEGFRFRCTVVVESRRNDEVNAINT